MARLWKMFGGEPYMVNPHLGILGLSNPGKKGSTMTAMQRRMARVRSFRKNPRRHHHRRTHRKNPFPVGGLIVNPHRRRSYKRNPDMLAGVKRHFSALPPLQPIIWTGVGFFGTPMVEHQLVTYLPTAITTNRFGKYAVRIGTVMLLSYGVGKFVGRAAGTYVGIGGGMYVVNSAIKEFAPSAASWLGLSAYLPNTGPHGMSAYQPNLAAADWGARNGIRTAGSGGMNVVPGRFRRFQ